MAGRRRPRKVVEAVAVSSYDPPPGGDAEPARLAADPTVLPADAVQVVEAAAAVTVPLTGLLPRLPAGPRAADHHAAPLIVLTPMRCDALEAMRMVLVPPDEARDRLAHWRAHRLRSGRAALAVDDQQPWLLRGRILRRAHRAVPVEVVVEPWSTWRVAVRVVPTDLAHHHPWPTAGWWRSVHGVLDEVVAVLRRPAAA